MLIAANCRFEPTLPAELIGRINDIADRKRVTRSAVVEAAVESFLSPDHADMQEAALTRRLDRLSRQVARLATFASNFAFYNSGRVKAVMA